MKLKPAIRALVLLLALAGIMWLGSLYPMVAIITVAVLSAIVLFYAFYTLFDND